ncbi:MAG: SAM-dependent methyltransferase [Elusimicrobia bacterium]|nr:SAM-dependent methyltransferase [Elusimicrobiota bacterium]
MTPFESLVKAEVRRRGRISFAEYMSWALYHPRHGYYMTRVRTGRAGDFVTNVQTGPLFGKLLAASFMEMWDALGSEKFTLVELGGSDGALAESVLRALEEKGRERWVSLHVVEASPVALLAARRRLSRYGHVHFYASVEEMEHTAGIEGCVYSNEFFDALPFHRVLWKEGRLWELWVETEGETLCERPGPPSPGLAEALVFSGVTLEEGQQGEVFLSMEEAVENIARVLSRGFVLTVDYGGAGEELFGDHRPRGTRRTFARHAVGDDPFSEIAERDITAHVDFARLARLGEERELNPLVYARQGSYFLSAGESVLRAAIEGATEADRPRISRQVQQLLHPHAFGGAFQILVQGKNVNGITLSGSKTNRIQRLVTPAIQSKIFSSNLPLKS